MDTVRIGQFLKDLRKEKGFTQEQLGEKVGITNKTVSRWENGNYIPPVECLVILSDIYGVSINEIVSGKRLTINEFSNAAEDNLRGVLEFNERTYKKVEKRLFTVMAISTLIAILIIILLPINDLGIGMSILLVFLIVTLWFFSNTVNLVALALNNERTMK